MGAVVSARVSEPAGGAAATASPGPLVDTYAQLPLRLVSGQGARVQAADGREYWDLYGGHAVALLGHAHPRITAALAAQAGLLTFYSNVVPLDVRDAAAAALSEFAPEPLKHVFFCNSGAEANENALNLALRQTGRRSIAALQGGFHGRTLLALAATDRPALHAGVEHVLCPTVRLPPNDPAALKQLGEDVAAVIVEPVLSMAGVIELSAGFLAALRARCDEIGALLIYDEVQTGMGRLGRPMAAGRCGVLPDIVTLAKGLANGVPMGAVLLSGRVARRVGAGDLGTTFGGGPLACAALLAVLRVLREEGWIEHAARLGEYARENFPGPLVSEVRGSGCLLGLRVKRPPRDVQAHLLARGFIVGTSAAPDVVRLLPPLNTPLAAFEELRAVLQAMED